MKKNFYYMIHSYLIRMINYDKVFIQDIVVLMLYVVAKC